VGGSGNAHGGGCREAEEVVGEGKGRARRWRGRPRGLGMRGAGWLRGEGRGAAVVAGSQRAEEREAAWEVAVLGLSAEVDGGSGCVEVGGRGVAAGAVGEGGGEVEEEEEGWKSSAGRGLGGEATGEARR